MLRCVLCYHKSHIRKARKKKEKEKEKHWLLPLLSGNENNNFSQKLYTYVIVYVCTILLQCTYVLQFDRNQTSNKINNNTTKSPPRHSDLRLLLIWKCLFFFLGKCWRQETKAKITSFGCVVFSAFIERKKTTKEEEGRRVRWP